MAKYMCGLQIDLGEVEAKSEEEARKIAWKMFLQDPLNFVDESDVDADSLDDEEEYEED